VYDIRRLKLLKFLVAPELDFGKILRFLNVLELLHKTERSLYL